MPVLIKPDPFSAVLLSSPPLMPTEEQKLFIRKVLDKSSSDSRFADKAYIAILLILAGSVANANPTVSSLTPNSAEIGDPSFTIHVHGTNFKPDSVIVFAGQDEPTTFVSETELTTGVNMSVWLGPDVLPVTVRNANGVQADPLMFTFSV
jgi:hypothetical protein